MIQDPVFLPPDPNLLVQQIVPLAGMITGVVITGFVALGPVGRAIGDVIRHLFGAKSKDAPAIGTGDMEELIGRLDQIQQGMSELAERQDFAERMLAQNRKDRALSGGKDVAG